MRIVKSSSYVHAIHPVRVWPEGRAFKASFDTSDETNTCNSILGGQSPVRQAPFSWLFEAESQSRTAEMDGMYFFQIRCMKTRCYGSLRGDAQAWAPPHRGIRLSVTSHTRPVSPHERSECRDPCSCGPTQTLARLARSCGLTITTAFLSREPSLREPAPWWASSLPRPSSSLSVAGERSRCCPPEPCPAAPSPRPRSR